MCSPRSKESKWYSLFTSRLLLEFDWAKHKMKMFYKKVGLSSTNVVRKRYEITKGQILGSIFNIHDLRTRYNRGWQPAPSEGFLKFFFFLKDKTSAPNDFGSCSFIPRAHFETSLVMVSYYGYEIWRHKEQVIKPFLSENACFFNFFQK